MQHSFKTTILGKGLLANWPLLLPIGSFLLLNAPLLTMKGIIAGGDSLTTFYPAAYAYKQALSAGFWPHWTPYLQSGFPLLASGQPSIVYPLNFLLILFLPVHIAYNLTVLLHGLLAIIFVYVWGRTLKLSNLASALMGCLFILTTPLAGSSIPMLEALAWTPALFLFAERGLQSKRPLSLWPICLIVGLQLLTGHPQTALYSLLTSSVYFCARLFFDAFSWKERIYWMVVWLLASLIGFLLAFPLLLPTYELSLFTIRANGISGSLIGEKSLFPPALSTFLIPTAQTFWGQSGLGGGAYIGVIPFLMALGAFFRKPKPRWFYPIVIMCAVAVVLALGRFSPLFPLVRQIPGLSSFRASSRFIFYTQFGLITLFGWNWDQLFSSPQSVANKWQERLFKFATAIFVLVSLVGYPLLLLLKKQLIDLASEITFTYIINDGFHVQPETYYFEKIEFLYQSVLDAAWGGFSTVVPLVSLLVGWLIIHLIRKNKISANVAFGGLAILIGIDLIVFTGEFNRLVPFDRVNSKLETAQLVEQVTQGGLCRMYSLTDMDAVTFQEDALNSLPPNYHALSDIFGIGIYNPLGFYDYYRLLENLSGVDLAFGKRPVSVTDVSSNRSLLNYLNVCALVSRVELDDFELVERVEDVFVYHNDDYLPRAFAVDEVMILPESADAVTAVLENIDQLSEKAILQESLAEQLTMGAAQNVQVDIKAYEDLFVKLDVVTDGTILLQLTDTNYPGWQAAIDGQPTNILTTNALFRGVVVPKGEHKITFSYVPMTFKLGLWIAAFAVIFISIWLGFWLFSQRYGMEKLDD